MVEDKVEIVKRSFDAIGRGDLDDLLALYDEEIEFLPLTGTRVESGGYRGHQGVRDYFTEIGEIWDVMEPHADQTETVGDRVVVVGGCAVRGRGSGVVTDAPLAWVITVRDGKVTSHRGYRTADEAREAAGLEEGEAVDADV
jgi:ketosteroid isomerase-like protein